MGQKVVIVALAIGMALVTEPGAYAQGRQTGILRGTTRDAQGLLLPDVTVSVQSPALLGVRQASSGAAGSFEIPGLPPGDYTITFSLEGFADVTETSTVSLGVVVVVPSPIASTGTSAHMTTSEADLLPLGRTVFRNTDELERRYDALMLQGRARIANSLYVDGSWTVQINTRR